MLADELVNQKSDELVVTDRDGIRFVIFNRPNARNALSNAMKQAFVAALREADDDAGVNLVIVTGAGRCFSAGADIKELRAGAQSAVRPHPAQALLAFGKPVIAAVDGACATGALEIALSCSFILASTEARFADTHAKIGLIAGWGMSALLPRAIGRRRANQIMSTGEFIDAATAYDWGLVNEVTNGDVTRRAIEVGSLIAANPSRAVNAQIRAMRKGDGASMAEALEIEESMKQAWRAANTGLFADAPGSPLAR